MEKVTRNRKELNAIMDGWFHDNEGTFTTVLFWRQKKTVLPRELAVACVW